MKPPAPYTSTVFCSDILIPLFIFRYIIAIYPLANGLFMSSMSAFGGIFFLFLLLMSAKRHPALRIGVNLRDMKIKLIFDYDAVILIK